MLQLNLHLLQLLKNLMTALCDITKCNMQEYFVGVYNSNFLKLSIYFLKIHS